MQHLYRCIKERLQDSRWTPGSTHVPTGVTHGCWGLSFRTRADVPRPPPCRHRCGVRVLLGLWLSPICSGRMLHVPTSLGVREDGGMAMDSQAFCPLFWPHGQHGMEEQYLSADWPSWPGHRLQLTSEVGIGGLAVLSIS